VIDEPMIDAKTKTTKLPALTSADAPENASALSSDDLLEALLQSASAGASPFYALTRTMSRMQLELALKQACTLAASSNNSRPRTARTPNAVLRAIAEINHQLQREKLDADTARVQLYGLQTMLSALKMSQSIKRDRKPSAESRAKRRSTPPPPHHHPRKNAKNAKKSGRKKPSSRRAKRP
jgi:hypothetical protein